MIKIYGEVVSIIFADEVVKICCIEELIAVSRKWSLGNERLKLTASRTKFQDPKR